MKSFLTLAINIDNVNRQVRKANEIEQFEPFTVSPGAKNNFLSFREQMCYMAVSI